MVFIALSSSEVYDDCAQSVLKCADLPEPRCLHTQSMDAGEDSSQNLELKACWIFQHGHMCKKQKIMSWPIFFYKNISEIPTRVSDKRKKMAIFKKKRQTDIITF